MIRRQPCVFAVLPNDRTVATRYHQSEDLTGPNDHVHHAIAIDVGERHAVRFASHVGVPKYLTISSIDRDDSAALGEHQQFIGPITIEIFGSKSATWRIILDYNHSQRT